MLKIYDFLKNCGIGSFHSPWHLGSLFIILKPTIFTWIYIWTQLKSKYLQCKFRNITNFTLKICKNSVILYCFFHFILKNPSKSRGYIAPGRPSSMPVIFTLLCKWHLIIDALLNSIIASYFEFFLCPGLAPLGKNSWLRPCILIYMDYILIYGIYVLILLDIYPQGFYIHKIKISFEFH